LARATFAGTKVLARMKRMDTAVPNALGAPTVMKTERHDRECLTSRLGILSTDKWTAHERRRVWPRPLV